MQEVLKLKEEKSKLEENHKELEEEVEQAETEVAPFKYKILEKNKEKSEVVRNKENYIDTENRKVTLEF